jgi:CubicO group peptidase (beta-lactamase class C family)
MRTWLVVALLTAFLHGCTGADPPPPDDDAAQLGEAVDQFVDDSYAQGMRNVRAILVSVDGETVVERYYDSSPEETAAIASVTKSIVSTLVGIAIDEGRLSLNQTLEELLPAHADRMSSAVSTITLHELLTMTAGLPEDGADGPSLSSDDWVTEILDLGTVKPPGAGFAYSSVSSHLLAAILVEATGQSVLAYAQERLFDPLGIDSRPAFQARILPGEPERRQEYEGADFAWPRDPQGIHVGYGFAKLTAPDMLALGTLFLDGGEWDGAQLVPASWVEEATSPLVDATEFGGEHYGYQWWVTEAGDHPAYAAVGFGGQIIEVVPDLDLVVVASTWIDDTTNFDASTWEFMVSQAIVPTLEGTDE